MLIAVFDETNHIHKEKSFEHQVKVLNCPRYIVLGLAVAPSRAHECKLQFACYMGGMYLAAAFSDS